MTVSSKAHIL